MDRKVRSLGKFRVLFVGASLFALAGACGGDVRIEEPGGDGNGGQDGVGGSGGTGGTAGSAGSGQPPHPPALCGNGLLDPGEDCDGVRFGGHNCENVTLGARPRGTLKCSLGCVFDASSCLPDLGTGGTTGVGGFTGTGGGPGPGGAGGNGGLGGSGSNGDPHIYTSDGLRYEFQAVGEFVMLEDERDPSFMIQVRQEPFHGSKSVSVNTAVAMRVGSDRVAIYAGVPPTITINGAERTLEANTALSGGGRIEKSKETYTVTFPAGDQFVIVASWKALLDVNYRQRAAHRRRLRGLLGSPDGAKENDLTARTGIVVAVPPPSPEAVYEVFGESYRITQAESLFDYDGGKSTASYTDRAFPRLGGKDEKPSLEQLVHGRDVCAAEGVKDPDLLLACALDVSFTRDVGFARAAAEAERVGRRQR